MNQPVPLLSAGNEPFWHWSRPKLSAGVSETGLIDVPDQTTDQSPSIIATITKAIAIIVIAVVSLAVAGWFILGMTILPTVTSGDARWLVKWAAYPEGQVPVGTITAFTDTTGNTGFTDRVALLTGSTPVSIATVVAGPGGAVGTDDTGMLWWDDHPTGFTTDEFIEPHLLGDNYVTVCVAGDACPAGSLTEMPVGAAIGKTVGQIDGFSLNRDIGTGSVS